MFTIINKQTLGLVAKVNSLEAIAGENHLVVLSEDYNELANFTTLELKLIYRNLGFVNGTDLANRQSVITSITRMLNARVCTDTVPDTSDEPETPEATPLAPKAGSRATIWEVADAAWSAAGKPLDIPTVLALRKKLMQELEFVHGIKKTTSSTALGDWQKARLN